MKRGWVGYQEAGCMGRWGIALKFAGVKGKTVWGLSIPVYEAQTLLDPRCMLTFKDPFYLSLSIHTTDTTILAWKKMMLEQLDDSAGYGVGPPMWPHRLLWSWPWWGQVTYSFPELYDNPPPPSSLPHLRQSSPPSSDVWCVLDLGRLSISNPWSCFAVEQEDSSLLHDHVKPVFKYKNVISLHLVIEELFGISVLFIYHTCTSPFQS